MVKVKLKTTLLTTLLVTLLFGYLSFTIPVFAAPTQANCDSRTDDHVNCIGVITMYEHCVRFSQALTDEECETEIYEFGVNCVNQTHASCYVTLQERFDNYERGEDPEDPVTEAENSAQCIEVMENSGVNRTEASAFCRKIVEAKRQCNSVAVRQELGISAADLEVLCEKAALAAFNACRTTTTQTCVDTNFGSNLNCPTGSFVYNHTCATQLICSGDLQWNGTVCDCPTGKVREGINCSDPEGTTDPDDPNLNNCPNDITHDLCVSCISAGNSWSSLGCMDVGSVSGLVVSLTRIALGVAGGLILLLFIYIGYLYQTGNSANIAAAKAKVSQIFSAILFLIFSVVLLRVIGINILNVVNPAVIG